MTKRWFQYFLHLIVWLFLYILPYLFSFEWLPNYASIFSNSGHYVHLISFIFLVVFFYLNYLLLVPRFYLNKKYILYLAIVCICFWFVTYLPMYILPRELFVAIPPPMIPGEQPLLFGRNYTILLLSVHLQPFLLIQEGCCIKLKIKN